MRERTATEKQSERALVVIDADELDQRIEAAIARALKSGSGPSASEWLDAAATAALLGVHRRTVAKLAASGHLPASRIGKLLRFRRVDVVALLEGEHG